MDKWYELKIWIENKESENDGIVLISFDTLKKKMTALETQEKKWADENNYCTECFGYITECMCNVTDEQLQSWEQQTRVYEELYGDLLIRGDRAV